MESRQRSSATVSGMSIKTSHSNDTKWSPYTQSAMALQSHASANCCVFCGSEAHDTEDCKEDLTLDEKKRCLASQGTCFRCTVEGHRA